MFGGGSQAPIDYVMQLGTVEGSSMRQAPDTGKNVGVLFNVAGIDGIEDGSIGEANDADVYGALGIVSRPLPPKDGKAAEVVCMRTADGLVPIAAKDSRLKMPGEAPHAGTVALVGYGGGFHSMDPVNDGQDGTIHVIYCPFDFDDDGNAQKAHSIILDPSSGNESITIAHAGGMAVMLFDDKLILKSKTGLSSLTIDDTGIQLSAPKIVLAGGVVVGNTAAAVPLLAGPASPPSTLFFVSP